MLTLLILFIMRLFSKKAKEPISPEQADRIARIRFPERYETYDFDGIPQVVDINKIARALFVCRLVSKSGSDEAIISSREDHLLGKNKAPKKS